MKTVRARRPAATRPAAMTVLGTIALSTLLACSERSTAAPTAPSLALGGARANRAESDKRAGAAATLTWEKTTRDLLVSHKIAPTTAARLYALHSIAEYAAIVAVSRSPNDGHGGGRAAYEARRGAIAGSSVQLLSVIVPDAAAALEAQLAAYGADASGRTHPQFTRGVALGRVAGDVMIKWAQNDRFSKPWDESTRNAPGLGIWEGALAPPGSTIRPPPAGYQFPTMTPYFLEALNGHSAQSQFRPPPPPEYLGTRFNTDLDEVRTIALNRTVGQADTAYLWNLNVGTVTTLGYWNEQAALFVAERGLDEQAASHVFAVMNAAGMDAILGCWEAKYFYLMLRPSMADAAIKRPTLERPNGPPDFPYTLPNHPSYPSGHSCVSSAAATVLSLYFPEHAAKLKSDLIDAGISRIYGGIHYRFDIEAGQELGRSTAEWAISYDRRRGLLAAVGLGERGRAPSIQ